MSAVKTHSGPSRRAKGKTQQSAPGAGASASTTKQTPAASTTTTTAQASTTSHPRTAVYRPLLASPFTVTWPTLSLADAEPLLHTLLEILVEHRIQLRDPPAKVTPKKKDKKKKAAAADPDAIEVDVAEDQPQEEEPPCVRPPWLHVGINAVNQSVEQSIATSVSDMHKDSKAASNPIAESGSTADATMSGTEPESADADAADPISPSSLPKMRFLFVCRADVDPPRLVAHLPMLTCTLNAISSSSSSSSTQGLCILLPFSRDAELKIATQLKIRRCAVLGISEDAPSSALERLDGVLGTLRSRDAGESSAGGQGTSALSPLRAPWLDAAVTVARSSIPTTSGGSTSDGSAAGPSETSNRSLPVTFGIPYVSTSINNLTTSVPSDMNAARTRKKESRKGRKAAAALKKEAEGQRKNGAMKVGARSAKAEVLGKETGKGKGDAKTKKDAQGNKGTATAKGKASEKSKNGTATKSAAGSAGAKLSESQRRRLRRQRLAEAQAGEKEKATEPQQKTKQITAGKKQGTANAKGDKKGPNGGETSAKEKGKQKGSEPNGKKADTTGKKGTAPAAQQDKTTTPSQSKAAKQKQNQKEKPADAGGTVPIAPKEAGQKRKRTDAVEGGADASTATNDGVKNPVKAGKSKGGAAAGVVPKGNKANPAELGGGGGGPTSKKKRVESSDGAVKSTAGVVAATEGSAKTVVGKAPVGAAVNGGVQGQKKKDGQGASTGAGGGKGKEDGAVAATKAP
ncbi:hypothetical protein CF326_g5531 [Tilletia indica]|nr:hypothetical protein CF326_g5531 [Tilletia indica]